MKLGARCWRSDMLETLFFGLKAHGWHVPVMMLYPGRIHRNNWALSIFAGTVVHRAGTSNFMIRLFGQHATLSLGLVPLAGWVRCVKCRTFCRMFYVAAWLLSVKANCFIVGMVTGTICYHPCASSFGGGNQGARFWPTHNPHVDLEDEHIGRA